MTQYFLGLFIGIGMGVVWSFSTIDAIELDKVNNTCNSNGGVETVAVDIWKTNVYCKDGAKFTLKY